MANELSITTVLSFLKGTAEADFPLSKTVTVSGSKFTRLMQSVGTSEEALDLGDVGTPGFVLMVNRDPTNFVSVRAATGGANCVKLKPGEPALFRFASSAPFVIADTGACVVEYLLIED